MQKKTDFLRIPNAQFFLRQGRKAGWICLLIFWVGCGKKDLDTQHSATSSLADSAISRQELAAVQPAERIISTAPNITEILFALGAEKYLVARSQACNFPPSVDSFPIVKTYPDLDLEQIAFHRPDLVLTTDELFTPDQIAMMKSRDIPLLVQSYRNIPQVLSGIEELGRVVGEEERARNIRDSLQLVLDGLTEEREQLSGFPKAILIVSEDPLVLVGSGGYIHELMELAGWENAFAHKELAYFQSTVEELQQVNPDVIFFPAANDSDISERFYLISFVKET